MMALLSFSSSTSCMVSFFIKDLLTNAKLFFRIPALEDEQVEHDEEVEAGDNEVSSSSLHVHSSH